MTTSEMVGQFLVNGVKSRVCVGRDCIRWWPVKVGREEEEEKDGLEKGWPASKRIEIGQVVGIKVLSALGAPSEAKRDERCAKIKVYYSKRNRNKSASQLFKLKKLSIQAAAQARRPRLGDVSLPDCNSLFEGSSGAKVGGARPKLGAIWRQWSEPVGLVGGGQSGGANKGRSSSLCSSALTSEPTTQTLPGAVQASSEPPRLEQLASRIREALALKRADQRRPQRLLVFVNPFGGKGKASQVYKSQVRRLLELAGVESRLVITKYANHARDTIEDPGFNVELFDGIVCVGGDGMFSELMNGLLFRYNRDKISMVPYDCRLSADRPVARLPDCAQADGGRLLVGAKSGDRLGGQFGCGELGALRRALGGIGQPFESPPIPIGVIGAGSTDANSFGLIGTNDVVSATLNIILGNQIKIDVCSVHSIEEDRLMRFVSTFVAYGYFGDVIRESEKLRWLGPSRYDVTGMNSLIKNRAYSGVVKILVASQDGSPHDLERCHTNCKLCKLSRNERPKDEEPKLALIEKQGSFIGVNAAVTACRCPQTKKGFSPNNHLANGCADLILVRPCSRIQYIQYLLRTGWTKKSAFDLKYVEAFRCRQFEFLARQERPAKLAASSSACSSASSVDQSSNSNSLDSKQSSRLSSTPSSPYSSWNVDGEILNEQSIRVKVNKRLLRVFGTGEPLA